MARNSIIFLLTVGLLYFVSFLFSRKNVLHEMIALWIWTIGFLLILLYEYFREAIERRMEHNLGIIVGVIIFSVSASLLSFIEMRVILERKLPCERVFTWQPVTVTLLFFISLIIGLNSVKIGYVLLFLSFVMSLFIYRPFPGKRPLRN